MGSNSPQTRPNPLPDKGLAETGDGWILQVVQKCFPNPGRMV